MDLLIPPGQSADSEPDKATYSDWQGKITVLERNNFDLKMKVYYLNEKLSSKVKQNSTLSSDTVDDDYHYDYGFKSTQFKGLTEELEVQKRKNQELDSELSRLRTLHENEVNRYEDMIKSKTFMDATLLDDTRKYEREAAFAIAEHDAMIIRKLQEELKETHLVCDRLKQQAEALKKDLQNKSDLLNDKDRIIGDLESSIANMQLRNKDIVHQLKKTEGDFITRNPDRLIGMELTQQREENRFLQEQLGRFRTVIKSQEEALNNLKEFSTVGKDGS